MFSEGAIKFLGTTCMGEYGPGGLEALYRGQGAAVQTEGNPSQAWNERAAGGCQEGPALAQPSCLVGRRGRASAGQLAARSLAGGSKSGSQRSGR